jgi:hypothetical protein
LEPPYLQPSQAFAPSLASANRLFGSWAHLSSLQKKTLRFENIDARRPGVLQYSEALDPVSDGRYRPVSYGKQGIFLDRALAIGYEYLYRSGFSAQLYLYLVSTEDRQQSTCATSQLPLRPGARLGGFWDVWLSARHGEVL